MIHSPEPWIISHLGEIKCNQIDIISIGQSSTVIPFGATLPSTEDRRRIVACVNVCAGIATNILEAQSEPFLTASKILAAQETIELKLKIIALERQRDELLAKYDELHTAAYEHIRGRLSRDELREAIAKAGEA